MKNSLPRSLPLALLALALAGCQTLSGDIASGWSFKESPPVGFRDWGYSVVSKADGHPVRAGDQAIRFEVRAGDCGSWPHIDWSDCDEDRERHELRTNDNWSGGERWYHWSIRLPRDWTVIHPVKVQLGQFHQAESHPAWLFQNERGGYSIDNYTTGSTLHKPQILTDDEMRGKWADILVHVRWTSGRDGFFRVYANGETEPRYSWTGPTKKPGRDVFFKFGLYRSHVSRRPGDEPTQVVYYDEVNRASTCAEATKFFDCAAIEKRPAS